MIERKQYIKPEIIKIILDNTISIQMQSIPIDPPPLGSDKKGTDGPFSSPFGDKPFG